MRSWQMITGLVIGVAIPTGFYAAQASGPTLTVQDYMEIQQLYHRYHWVVDARNGDAWANLFTPDGEFHAGSTTTVGRENLAALPFQSLGAATATTALHFVTNVRIEPSPEGAHGGAYLLNVVPGGAGNPATITAVVVYEDILVKTSEGWRLKRRQVHSNGGLAPSTVTFPSPN